MQAKYRALLDPTAVAAWRVPDGMTFQVHVFEMPDDGESLDSRQRLDLRGTHSQSWN